jgi:hypothetical protein
VPVDNFSPHPPLFLIPKTYIVYLYTIPPPSPRYYNNKKIFLKFKKEKGEVESYGKGGLAVFYRAK